MKRAHVNALPWRRTEQPEVGTGRYFYFDADFSKMACLSESDQGALTDALTTIGALTYAQIKRLLHADPAYLEAWQPDGQKKAFQMSYGMLLDAPDHEQAETVAFFSKHS